MARLPRLEVVGLPHLLVQRVSAGSVLAVDEADRLLLLGIFKEAAREHGVAIHAYCLATDHFHLLLTPERPKALSLFMQAVGRRYVGAFNRKHQRQGGLWAGRYRATVLDPAFHLLDAMVWVELHAMRHGGAAPWQEFEQWSSARHHLGRVSDPLVTDHALYWSIGNTPFEREAAWRKRLEDGLGSFANERIAQAMLKGWALVPENVREQVEIAANRRVAPRPRGRPKMVRSPSN